MVRAMLKLSLRPRLTLPTNTNKFFPRLGPPLTPPKGGEDVQLRRLGARFLRLCGFDGSLNVLLFFRRRKHCRHAQSFYPKFPRPSAGVIKMLVLFSFNLVVGLLQNA